jgi:hypothetical protein
MGVREVFAPKRLVTVAVMAMHMQDMDTNTRTRREKCKETECVYPGMVCFFLSSHFQHTESSIIMNAKADA